MTVCDCVEGCQLADRFTPATRELMVFTKNPKRYFDLDAVREPHNEAYAQRRFTPVSEHLGVDGVRTGKTRGGTFDESRVFGNPNGAPPLDWWLIPSPKPQPVTEYEGAPMTATFYVGDAIETMNKLPENSVDLILTSPPFLALRSYLPADHPDKALEGGSQATPGAFIDWLVDVVEACDRVLAPHGSLVFELGDTYSGSGGAGGDYDADGLREGQPRFKQRNDGGQYGYYPPQKNSKYNLDIRPVTGGKSWPLAKSLSLIPELFRLTLVYGTNPLTGRTTERWRLRNVVRWVRPNPPVGALGDKFRPATSELMVFCKSAKRYFDLDSVRTEHKYGDYAPGMGDKLRDPTRGNGGDLNKPADHVMQPNPAGAPPLDWWNIPPGGYEGAHYAVFPPELCIKPIKAMCPEKVCRQCGEPSRREVDSQRTVNGIETDELIRRPNATVGSLAVGGGGLDGRGHGATFGTNRTTTGWTDCDHDDWRPGVVLDPFGGSGTTALVATGHGRDAILIDLDGRNYDLALQRVGPFILQRGVL